MKLHVAVHIVVALCLSFGTGCTGIENYYPIHSLSVPSEIVGRSAPESSPSVSVAFEFQTNGNLNRAVTSKYRQHVIRIIEQSKLFTSVQSKLFSSVSDRQSNAQAVMRIAMNNVYDSLAGAVAAGFISGITLGLIGSSVTDNYVFEARYQSQDKEPFVQNYTAAVTSTSGLIVLGVDGVNPMRTPGEAVTEILERVIKTWLLDIQRGGHL